MFSARQPCVLVVDGDTAVRASTAMLLTAMDLDSLLAENGDAALTAVCERHFDCALVDIGLSHSGGKLLADKLRENAPDMPIIIVSADPARRKGREVITQYWLDKPSSSKAMQQMIGEILSSRAYVKERASPATCSTISADGRAFTGC